MTDAYRRRVFAERYRLSVAQADGVGYQRAVLADLLARNATTVFGREHRFGRIGGIDDFRKAMPIRDRAGFAPWVERAAHGERGVLTADDPIGGTIPLTRRFLRTTFFPVFYAAWAPMAEHFPETLTEPDAVLNLGHAPLAGEPGGRAPRPRSDDHLEASYLRLRRAVEADVRGVVGVDPAAVAALPYRLRLWWPRIVGEIRDGTLGGRPFRAPNPGRAGELERLGSPLPAHVWPNLRVIVCRTSGVASLYLPRLREEFGIGVTVLPAPVAAAEGPVAVALDRHGSAGSLAVTTSVYEFVDADEAPVPDAATLEPHELEPGREYHVVLSHVGGLYRYAPGDVVRVVDTAGGVPRVEHAGRATTHGVAGERLRDAHLVGSLAAATATTGLEVRDVSCHPPATAGAYYQVAVAPRTPWSDAEATRFAAVLDEALAARVPGYRTARAAGRLGRATLRVLPADAFLRAWHDEVAAGTHRAHDRVIRGSADWDRLVGAAQP